MIVFLLRRLFQSLAVMLAVALIAFTLFRFVGDPINGMVSQDATQAERDALRQSLGLNDSVVVQFGRFVGFDRRETVTIPPLPDAQQWSTFDGARLAMFPNFMQTHAATRYRAAI